ncbi:MAG: histidine phosphatase family protein [Pikeienuella sp.]
MRQLLLMRHSEAAGGLDDHARPLTRRGRLGASLMGAFVGELLSASGVQLGRVVLSDSLRTRQTYAAMRPSLVGGPEAEDDPGLYAALPDRIAAVVAATPEEVDALLVIGHNPGIESLLAALLGPNAPQRVPPGALAALALPAGWHAMSPGAATLIAFESPRSLV